ncbi:MAG: hypothetical protein ACFE8E_13365 [Candidatus Hodarchaeota archaeon]
MNEDFPKNKIKKLELELELKQKEISDYLNKIDQLENTIMELEVMISEPEKSEDSYLQFRLKELEKTYRELKDKLGFLRLENVRLKQGLNEMKRNPVLVPVLDEKKQSKKLKPLSVSKSEENNDDLNQEDIVKDIHIICPQCENKKLLKVPLKIINQSNNIITISVPSGIVCSHNFQVFVDKYFKIRGYQLADFEFPKIEYYQSSLKDETQKEDSNVTLSSSPKFQEIINILRRCVDDREILGSAIFTTEGRVLYTSIPQKTLLDTIREFEIRNEKNVHSVIKMFLELKNQQKVCSENLEIQDIELILVLVFSELVNFGIANMLLREIVKQLKVDS